jgi:hypothetical protein
MPHKPPVDFRGGCSQPGPFGATSVVLALTGRLRFVVDSRLFEEKTENSRFGKAMT